MKKSIKILFIVFIILSLFFFVMMTDVNSVFEQISKIGFNFVYILLISLLAYLAGSIAWKHCFSITEIPLTRLFYIRTIGEMITLFNPTNIVAGEAYKHYSLKAYVRKTSIILDSILISRSLMILSQVLLSLVCLNYFMVLLFGNIVLIYGIAGFFLLLLLIICIKMLASKYSLRIKSFISLPSKLSNAIDKLDKILLRIKVQVKQNPRQIVKAFFWSLIHWILGALEILLILHLLGVSTGFMDALIVDMGVVIMKSIAGFIPAQIGVEELSNKMMLNVIGLQYAGLWLSVSVLRRAKQVIWICICFCAYSIMQFIKVKKYNNGDSLCNT